MFETIMRWLARRNLVVCGLDAYDLAHQLQELIYRGRRAWARHRPMPAVVGVHETPWLCSHVRVVDRSTGEELKRVIWADADKSIVHRFRTAVDGDYIVDPDGNAASETVSVPCQIDWR